MPVGLVRRDDSSATPSARSASDLAAQSFFTADGPSARAAGGLPSAELDFAGAADRLSGWASRARHPAARQPRILVGAARRRGRRAARRRYACPAAPQPLACRRGSASIALLARRPRRRRHPPTGETGAAASPRTGAGASGAARRAPPERGGDARAIRRMPGGDDRIGAAPDTSARRDGRRGPLDRPREPFAPTRTFFAARRARARFSGSRRRLAPPRRARRPAGRARRVESHGRPAPHPALFLFLFVLLSFPAPLPAGGRGSVSHRLCPRAQLRLPALYWSTYAPRFCTRFAISSSERRRHPRRGRRSSTARSCRSVCRDALVGPAPSRARDHESRIRRSSPSLASELVRATRDLLLVPSRRFCGFAVVHGLLQERERGGHFRPRRASSSATSTSSTARTMLLSRGPHSRSRNSVWISSAGTPGLRACLGVSSPSDSAREPRPLVRDEDARDDPPARDELASWDALLSDAARVLTEPAPTRPSPSRSLPSPRSCSAFFWAPEARGPRPPRRDPPSRPRRKIRRRSLSSPCPPCRRFDARTRSRVPRRGG